MTFLDALSLVGVCHLVLKYEFVLGVLCVRYFN
jgi:hypothetical protein